MAIQHRKSIFLILISVRAPDVCKCRQRSSTSKQLEINIKNMEHCRTKINCNMPKSQDTKSEVVNRRRPMQRPKGRKDKQPQNNTQKTQD